MFTGIIECMGEVVESRKEGSNIYYKIASPVSTELKIDQSLSHDGVCLTVVGVEQNIHTVIAIEETLKRSSLQQWKAGYKTNLERAMPMGARLDGHIVQGHVDTTARVNSITEAEGSWYFNFKLDSGPTPLLVDKGSVTVNGVSLTVVNPHDDHFTIAVIPYTFAHTNFRDLKKGDIVNIEFDIISKYVSNLIKPYLLSLNADKL